MFAPSLQSNVIGAVRQPRVQGGVRAIFGARAGSTILKDCEERDGYKLRLPRGGKGCEGVIINTGGGVAGGDRVTHKIVIENDATATLTSQAAERIYRSQGDPSTIEIGMSLGEGSSLAWLPQETILFNSSNLVRMFDIEMPASATLLMAEIAVFGRVAMGERVAQGRYLDRWRIRRAGKLAFAESIKFEGDLDRELQRGAVGAGARVAATMLLVSPAAEDKLQTVRDALENVRSRIAASAWNGLLCVRGLGQDLETVRNDLSLAIVALRGEPMPRVWRT